MADCFSGLQKDLVTDTQAGTIIQDIQAFVLQDMAYKYNPDDPYSLLKKLKDPKVRKNLLAYYENLNSVLDPSEGFNMSPSAKAKLARERSKVGLLWEMADGLRDPLEAGNHYMSPLQGKMDAWQAKLMNPKFFGNQYPIGHAEFVGLLNPQLDGSPGLLQQVNQNKAISVAKVKANPSNSVAPVLKLMGPNQVWGNLDYQAYIKNHPKLTKAEKALPTKQALIKGLELDIADLANPVPGAPAPPAKAPPPAQPPPKPKTVFVELPLDYGNEESKELSGDEMQGLIDHLKANGPTSDIYDLLDDYGVADMNVGKYVKKNAGVDDEGADFGKPEWELMVKALEHDLVQAGGVPTAPVAPTPAPAPTGPAKPKLPDVLVNGKYYVHMMSSVEMNETIKALVKLQYGPGVTHTDIGLGKMTKEMKSKWINNFINGHPEEMLKTEKAALAKSGKPHKLVVNGTHPGLPENMAKNPFTGWAPWDPSGKQLPAGTVPKPASAGVKSVYLWTDAEIAEYAKAAGLDDLVAIMNPYQVGGLVQAHVSGNQLQVDKQTNVSLKNPYKGPPVSSIPVPSSPVPPPPTVAPAPQQPAAPVFTLSKKTPPKAGTHPVYLLDDQFGETWVFKPDKEAFRPDTEDAALRISKLFGFDAPDSAVIDFDPTSSGKLQRGVVQRFVENSGGVKGYAPSKLTALQLEDMLKEHVLDWALDNDDTHGDNLVRLKNGHILGIDKGRSFKHPGTNPLKRGQLSKNASVYYEQIYADFVGGKLNGDEFDAAVLAARKQARRMARVSDDDIRAQLEYGFKKRTIFPTTREKLIQDILDRKNKLDEDFDKFFRDIYKEAGRAYPELPLNPPHLDGPPGLHDSFVGFSDELFEAARASQSRGVPTFFAGTDIEDAHMLVWTEKRQGQTATRMEMKLRKEADAKVSSFLQNNGLTLQAASGVKSGQAGPVTQNWGTSSTAVETFSDHIIAGAKTVNHHIADKQYNTVKIGQMASAKTYFENLKWDKSWAQPENVFNEMKAHYLAQVKQVEDAMASTAKIPILSKYVPPPPKPVATNPSQPKYKLSKRQSLLDVGAIDANGDLVMTTGTTTSGQTGTEFVVESDDLILTYRPWASATGTAKAQQGLTRITMKPGGDPSKALELLEEIGVEMTPATEQDMELFYWRHINGIIEGRGDAAKYAHIKAPPGLTHEKELEHYRTQWGKHVDPKRVENWVKSRSYMPRFDRYSERLPNAKDPNGRPYWLRHDVDLADLTFSHLPRHASSDDNVALALVKSGGLFSTEERTRLLGRWVSGGSSTADQGRGSSHFLFSRQNQAPNVSDQLNGRQAQILMSPEVMLRTSTYSYARDNFGDLTLRNQTFWDLGKLSGFTAKGNEAMIKYGAGLLDSIEVLAFKQATMRNEAIAYLKKQGITEIRGVPVEQRLVMVADRDKAAAQMLALAKKRKK